MNKGLDIDRQARSIKPHSLAKELAECVHWIEILGDHGVTPYGACYAYQRLKSAQVKTGSAPCDDEE